MIPNKEYIIGLLKKFNWSQRKFATKAGVSNTTISRWLSGKRGAGAGLIKGILRAFPHEQISNLFIVNEMTSNKVLV